MLARGQALTPAPRRCVRFKDAAAAGRARRLDCANAGACLKVAAREGWPAFSCSSCGAYEPPPASMRAAALRALDVDRQGQP